MEKVQKKVRELQMANSNLWQLPKIYTHTHTYTFMFMEMRF